MKMRAILIIVFFCWISSTVPLWRLALADSAEIVTIDFDDGERFGQSVITCPTETGDDIYECNPAHHEWLRSKGIDITGSPPGALSNYHFAAPLGNPYMIGYYTQSEPSDGLGPGEMLNIHLFYGLAKSIQLQLASTPSTDSNVENVNATLIAKAFGQNEEALDEQSVTFSGVTNGTFTPGTIELSTDEFSISNVTIELSANGGFPFGGIFILGLTMKEMITEPMLDNPPVLTLPRYSIDYPAVSGLDFDGARVDSYRPGPDMFAYDAMDDAIIDPKCDPPSGSYFKVGIHTVTCEAVDSAGHVRTGSFIVPLIDPAGNMTEDTKSFTPISGMASSIPHTNLTTYHYPVSTSPFDVVVNAKTQRAFVSNMNNNTISALDLARKQVVDTVFAGGNPSAMAVNPNTNMVYAAGQSRIYVFDGNTLDLITKIRVMHSSELDLPVDLERNRIFAVGKEVMHYDDFVPASFIPSSENNNTSSFVSTASATGLDVTLYHVDGTAYSENALFVIDGDSNEIIRKIPIPGMASAIDFNPITNMVYIAYTTNQDKYPQPASLSVINGDSFETVAKIKLKGLPSSIIVNPTTNRIYLSNVEQGSVSVIDGATNKQLEELDIGEDESSLAGLAIDKGRNIIYVSNRAYAMDSITMINGTNDEIIDSIQIGSAPTGLSFDDSAKQLYIADWSSNSVISTDLYGQYLYKEANARQYNDSSPIQNIMQECYDLGIPPQTCNDYTVLARTNPTALYEVLRGNDENMSILQAMSSGDNYSVIVYWQPKALGEDNLFYVFIFDNHNDLVKPIQAKYDIGIYKDGALVADSRRIGEKSPFQPFTFDVEGSYSIRVENIDGDEKESAEIPIQVTPEFPATSLSTTELVALLTITSVMIILSRTGKSWRVNPNSNNNSTY